MSDFALVWAASSVAVFLLMYAARCLRQRRLARPWKLHLPGVLVLSIVFGAVPAYLYDQRRPPPVELPESLMERPVVR